MATTPDFHPVQSVSKEPSYTSPQQSKDAYTRGNIHRSCFLSRSGGFLRGRYCDDFRTLSPVSLMTLRFRIYHLDGFAGIADQNTARIVISAAFRPVSPVN
jgi:hypothetical protein